MICASCFRVHAHAASVLINFCEDVERDTLLPYLDSIVERLKLLNPAGDSAALGARAGDYGMLQMSCRGPLSSSSQEFIISSAEFVRPSL
jgi:hypothetical protein